MRLLSAIKLRLFPPELCRIAKSGDAAALSELLNRSTVVVVGADLGPPIPFDAEPQVAIDAIETAAHNKAFDGVLRFDVDDDSFLPIFTDQTAAESFCGAYCSLLGHTHAYRLFSIPGHYIREAIDENDFIVVNPQYVNEAEIDRSQSKSIRDRLLSSESPDQAQFLSLAIPMTGVRNTIEFSPE